MSSEATLNKMLETRRPLSQRIQSLTERIKRVRRRIRFQESRRGVPAWVPDAKVGLWRKPWTKKARSDHAFRLLLWQHGYASPNFTERETRCKRGDRVPESLRKNAQNQAFTLEIVRHKLGNPSMPVLSWYRPADYNAQIGGATNSQHIQANATDFDSATVDRIGRSKFDAVMNDVYENGGYGSYPAGSRHSDVRGYRARWTSF